MSLKKFEALTKVKPEILQSLYATADDDKKRSFTAVLELVEQLQNSEADGRSLKPLVLLSVLFNTHCRDFIFHFACLCVP